MTDRSNTPDNANVVNFNAAAADKAGQSGEGHRLMDEAIAAGMSLVMVMAPRDKGQGERSSPVDDFATLMKRVERDVYA